MGPFWAPPVGFKNCSAMVKHLQGRISYALALSARGLDKKENKEHIQNQGTLE